MATEKSECASLPNFGKEVALEKSAKYLPRSWLSTLLSLVTEPTTVKFFGQVLKGTPADIVTISPKFFRHYECLKCGRCCGFETSLVYTDKDILRGSIPADAEDRLHPMMLLIKQGSVTRSCYLYITDWVIGEQPCPWLKDNQCTVHAHAPIQCRMNPVYFDRFRVRGMTGIRLINRMFNRNWRIKCPMKPRFYSPMSLRDDVDIIQRFSDVGDSLGIKTHLPAILSRLRPLLLEEHSFWSSSVTKASIVFDVKGQEELI